MTKRWLSLVVVLTLLVSCFAGAAAEVTPKATQLPVISFTPAKTEFVFEDAKDAKDTVLGTFSVDKGADLADAIEDIRKKLYTDTSGNLQLGYEDMNGNAGAASLSDTGVLKIVSLSMPTTLNELSFFANANGFDNDSAAASGFYYNFFADGKVDSYERVKFAKVYDDQEIADITFTGVAENDYDSDCNFGDQTGTIKGVYGATTAVANLNAYAKNADSQNITGVTYTWTSSDDKVVKAVQRADEAYKVDLYTLSTGIATITVKATNKAGSLTETYIVSVTDKNPASDDLSIEVVNAPAESPAGKDGSTSNDAYELHEGQTLQLKAVFENGVTNKEVTWSSGNASYVTVDANGLVKAVKEGNAVVITATSKANTDVKADFYVKPKEASTTANVTAVIDYADGTQDVVGTNEVQVTKDGQLSFNIASQYTDVWYILSATESNPSAATVVSTGTKYTPGTKIDLNTNGTYYLYAAAKYQSGDPKDNFVDGTKIEVKIAVTKISVTASPAEVNGVGNVALSVSYEPANANIKLSDITVTLPAGLADKAATEKANTGLELDTNGTAKADKLKTIVTAGAAGTYKIKAEKDGVTGTATVTVKDVAITGIKVEPTSLTIQKDEKATIKVTSTPDNAPAPTNVTYTSKNESIAEVTTNGEVTAEKEGSTYIEISTVAGLKTYTYSVPVNVVEATKVSTPVFDKASGSTFNTQTKITVTTATPNATIYYTLDGSDPYTSATREMISGSTGTITLPDNKTTTVKAYAEKANLTGSDVATATYTVKILADELELNPNTSISLTGKDEETVTATVSSKDNTDATPADTSVKVTVADPTVVSFKTEVPASDKTKTEITFTALKVGQTTATVETADGAKKTIAVSVSEATVKSIAINEKYEVPQGQWVEVTAAFKSDKDGAGSKVEPLNDGVTWKLSNPTGETNAQIISTDGLTARVEGLVAGKNAQITVESAATDSYGKPLYSDTAIIAVTAASTTVQAPVLSAKTVEGNDVDLKGTPTEAIVVKADSPTVGATVYYTTDNTIPTSASTVFPAEGLKVAENTVLKVIAIKDGKSSSVVTQNLVFNFTVTKVTLNQTSATIVKGSTLQLEATLTPPEANTRYTWKSDKTDVATVSSTGLVTAKGTGTATITVTTSNGVEATCTVNVVPMEATSLAISPASIPEMVVGDSATLTAMLTPANADGTVRWTTSDSKIVSLGTMVDKTVVINAKAEGTATITASYAGLTATCQVTVIADVPQTEPTKAPTFALSATTVDVLDNEAVTKVIGQFTAGSGETMAQVTAYYDIGFTVKATDATGAEVENYATVNVDRNGVATMAIANTGSKDVSLALTWKLTWKTTASGAGTLNGVNGTAKLEVNVTQKPTAITFTAATVADTSLEGGKTATLDFGTIANYADFTATGVAVTATANVSGEGITATAAIDSTGKVTATVEGLVKGEYTVTVTLSASGCTSVTTNAAKVTVTSDKPRRYPWRRPSWSPRVLPTKASRA